MRGEVEKMTGKWNEMSSSSSGEDSFNDGFEGARLGSGGVEYIKVVGRFN